MLPPTGGANRRAYDAARPTLGIKPDALVDLGGGLGLNPDLTGLGLLAQRGRVAWLPGIGMADPNLSHFVSADVWGRGSALATTGTGWLGRYADLAFATTDVLRGHHRDRRPAHHAARPGPQLRLHHRLARLRLPDRARAAARLRDPWEPALLEAGFDAAVSDASAGVPPGQAAAARVGKAFLSATRSFGTNGNAPGAHPLGLLPGRHRLPGAAGPRRRRRSTAGSPTSSSSSPR